MPNKAISEAKTVCLFAAAFLKWLAIASLIGLAGGGMGTLFYVAVSHSTLLREAHPWLLLLLPAGGAAIAGLYALTRMEAKNTNAIIDSIHSGESLPLLLAPVIFIATVITHLCGGSAGREGAALQIGGGLGNAVGRLFRLDEKDMRLAVLCGMSAVFSALFGTPITAALFALEVISVGIFYYAGLMPCLIASIAAFAVTRLAGVEPTRFVIPALPFSADLIWRVGALGVICAVASCLLCVTMHGTERLLSKYLPNPFLRAAVGGAVIVALTYAVGSTDYNGAGTQAISAALEQGAARPAAFLWKLLFTAITLGSGFRGGEVVPTFFIGATLGCVVGPLIGIPASFAAAIALAAVFCGAVNCPVASIALAAELFGAESLIYFALACGISYMLSGYFGLYSSQKIMYSKTRPEFINIRAK